MTKNSMHWVVCMHVPLPNFKEALKNQEPMVGMEASSLTGNKGDGIDF